MFFRFIFCLFVVVACDGRERRLFGSEKKQETITSAPLVIRGTKPKVKSTTAAPPSPNGSDVCSQSGRTVTDSNEKWNSRILPISQIASIFPQDTKCALGQTLNRFLTAVDSCFGSTNSWSDRELGKFDASIDSPYCSASCLRNVFCCVPQTPQDLDVRFIMSSAGDGYAPSRPFEVKYGDKELRSLVKSDIRSFVWMVHGFLNDYREDGIFNETADAYLKRNYNIIIVDWHKGNRLYLQSVANVRVVGALLGQMMDYLDVAERSICSGFSLGAHVCGEAGKFVQRKGRILAKCHGIDPAGPGFDGCGPEVRLDPSDCREVTSIHTSQFVSLSSLLGEQGLGTSFKTGHCDFWLNHGLDQPFCDNTTFSSLISNVVSLNFNKLGQEASHAISCSHSRGMTYYLSQVQRKCHFKGVEGECGGGVNCLRSRVTMSTNSTTDTNNRTRIFSLNARDRELLKQFGVNDTEIEARTLGQGFNPPSMFNIGENRDRGLVKFVQGILANKKDPLPPIRRPTNLPNYDSQAFNPQITKTPVSSPISNKAEQSFIEAPRSMIMSPDDECRSDYNVDYKVQTTGKYPFC